jgi:hypothetical protein
MGSLGAWVLGSAATRGSLRPAHDSLLSGLFPHLPSLPQVDADGAVQEGMAVHVTRAQVPRGGGSSSKGATTGTLAFRRSSGPGHPFMVLLHDARVPDPLEWKSYLEALGATLAIAKAQVHVFIATDGGGPNAAQRKELAAVLERGPADALSHIFTTDAFVRGIVTAFRWIARARAVAHTPTELALACSACRHSASDVLAELAALQESFTPVETLRLMRGEANPAPTGG